MPNIWSHTNTTDFERLIFGGEYGNTSICHTIGTMVGIGCLTPPLMGPNSGI
jgi:hypothetical protein